MIAALNLQQHPLSAAFPRMSADEFQNLRDSIDNNGVLNPITLFDGMVLDGWNRYSAANEVGMPCPSVELGDVDPQDFVIAQNKDRRHITMAQLAMAANEVYKWRGAGRLNTNSALSAELKQSEVSAKTGVSVRSLQQADVIKKTAAREVIEAIDRGEVGLPKAAAIAKLPKSEQAAAINKPLPKHIEPPEAEDIDFRKTASITEDEYTPLDAAKDQIQELQAMLAVANLHSTNSEDQAHAATLIADLRARIKTLETLNKQLVISRDTFQNEAAHLKKNVKRLQGLNAGQDKKAV